MNNNSGRAGLEEEIKSSGKVCSDTAQEKNRYLSFGTLPGSDFTVVAGSSLTAHGYGDLQGSTHG